MRLTFLSILPIVNTDRRIDHLSSHLFANVIEVSPDFNVLFARALGCLFIKVKCLATD